MEQEQTLDEITIRKSYGKFNWGIKLYTKNAKEWSDKYDQYVKEVIKRAEPIKK